MKFDTVIRTYVKNQQRLNTLNRTIESWNSKGMSEFGKLIIVDDISPMAKEVKALAETHKLTYYLCDGEPDTKNGLYHSLLCQDKFPVLCCVDDMVFGQGTKSAIKRMFLNDYEKVVETAGCIGMFACYGEETRKVLRVPGTDLWNIKNEILYALVCHFFTPKLAKIVIDDWQKVLKNEIPYPCMCDDIWVKEICIREGLLNYNTILDYAQHTGMRNRTFGEGDGGAGSDYISNMFVGE